MCAATELSIDSTILTLPRVSFRAGEYIIIPASSAQRMRACSFYRHFSCRLIHQQIRCLHGAQRGATGRTGRYRELQVFQGFLMFS